MRKIVLLLTVVGVAFTALSCRAGDDDVIRIGAIFPLTGRVAHFGVASRDGGLLAVEQINEAGGLLGKRVVLLSEDDQGTPAMTIDAFSRLTMRERVNLIFGSSTSGATMAITELAQDLGIVVMTPSATNINITRAGDFIFRACFTDPFQGAVNADFAFYNLGVSRAAVLFDVGADYNRGLAEAFRDRFVSLGGEIVAWETYMTGARDFSSQVTRIRATEPELVFLPNYYEDVALQIRQLRAQGVAATLLGGDGWDGLTDHIGAEAIGGFWSSGFSVDTPDPRGVAFVEAFEARFNQPATQFAALGYDAIRLLAAAIEIAGSADPAAVRDALMEVDDYFVTGRIRFDENRNPIKRVVFLEIQERDGGLVNVYTTTVYPEY